MILSIVCYTLLYCTRLDYTALHYANITSRRHPPVGARGLPHRLRRLLQAERRARGPRQHRFGHPSLSLSLSLPLSLSSFSLSSFSLSPSLSLSLSLSGGQAYPQVGRPQGTGQDPQEAQDDTTPCGGRGTAPGGLRIGS